MSKKHSTLRFSEFAKAAAAGAFVGAVALQPVTATAYTGSIEVDQGNAQWFVNTNVTFTSTDSQWGMSEASLHTASGTRSDAFDGVLAWHVYPSGSVPPGPEASNGYVSPGGIVSTDTTYGETITGRPQTISGLTVQGEMFFSPTKAVVRSMLNLQNPTGAPISVVVGNYNNLGSDNNTELLTTSSGDATFDASDNWFVSCQAGQAPPACDATLDPVLTYAIQNAGAAVRGADVSPGGFKSHNQEPSFNYSVTVPAGATRRLIIFVQLSNTPANAEADAPSFNSSTSLQSTDYLHGLTSSQLSEVVNWQFLATPSLSLVSSPNPATVGKPITFTATFTGGTTPTGSVTICADDATCVAPTASCVAPIVGVTASCSISTLPMGSHSVTALYAGDVNNAPATSGPVTQQVSAAPVAAVLPAPTLGRWALLLLGALIGVVARLFVPARRR